MKEIVQALPLENSILHIQFNTGEQFDVDIKPFIKSGVSNALTDKSFFNEVTVQDGFITWPNGYDFCPEFLYKYVTAQPD
jgi:hypothetical protein